MDLQFHGANCVTLTLKGARVIIDDNLADLGGKSITKPDDVTLFTSAHGEGTGRLSLDGPGEYEVSDISVIGIPARAHIDEPGKTNATMFKLIVGELTILVTGHVYPQLSDKQLEAIGLVDVMFVPVGGSGYTTDAIGALKLIKEIEPKLVVPTHFADKTLNFPVPQVELAAALHELGMEVHETIPKLKVKHGELPEVTRLVILEKA